MELKEFKERQKQLEKILKGNSATEEEIEAIQSINGLYLNLGGILGLEKKSKKKGGDF